MAEKLEEIRTGPLAHCILSDELKNHRDTESKHLKSFIKMVQHVQEVNEDEFKMKKK